MSSSRRTECGQNPALIEADIAGRRADEARHRVPLHIFGHVETDQLHAERSSQLPRNFGFTNTGWAREEIIPDRLFRITQTSTRQLDR